MNQWDGREKKGGKVKDKTGLFSKSGPKGRRKATRLYHLIQEIATQTFRSIRNQNHSHSDSRRIQEPPALVTPATSSLPPGPLFPAPDSPLPGIDLSSNVTPTEVLAASLLKAINHSLSIIHNRRAVRAGTWSAVFKAVPPGLSKHSNVS